MEPKTPPKKLLLVEGKEDKYVVEHLWSSHYSEPCPFEIEIKGGIENLTKSISTELKAPGRETLGILIDSNDSPPDRWKKIEHQIKKVCGKEILANLTPNGVIVNTKPRIGVWLMPNNDSAGELEDFIFELIPKCDPIWPRVDQFINDIPEEHRKFKDKKDLKAKIHVWLATRGSPRPIGTAISANDLDTSVPIAQNFCNWLRQLFTDTS